MLIDRPLAIVSCATAVVMIIVFLSLSYWPATKSLQPNVGYAFGIVEFQEFFGLAGGGTPARRTELRRHRF